jgi:hypothetical protein
VGADDLHASHAATRTGPSQARRCPTSRARAAFARPRARQGGRAIGERRGDCASARHSLEGSGAAIGEEALPPAQLPPRCDCSAAPGPDTFPRASTAVYERTTDAMSRCAVSVHPEFGPRLPAPRPRRPALPDPTVEEGPPGVQVSLHSVGIEGRNRRGRERMDRSHQHLLSNCVSVASAPTCGTPQRGDLSTAPVRTGRACGQTRGSVPAAARVCNRRVESEARGVLRRLDHGHEHGKQDHSQIPRGGRASPRGTNRSACSTTRFRTAGLSRSSPGPRRSIGRMRLNITDCVIAEIASSTGSPSRSPRFAVPRR